jgi:hypothetical protein
MFSPWPGSRKHSGDRQAQGVSCLDVDREQPSSAFSPACTTPFAANGLSQGQTATARVRASVILRALDRRIGK